MNFHGNWNMEFLGIPKKLGISFARDVLVFGLEDCMYLTDDVPVIY